MRKVITSAALLLACAGCTTQLPENANHAGNDDAADSPPTTEAAAESAPYSISTDRWGNMGTGWREWVIDRNGAVRMGWDEAGDSRVHRRRFTASPAAFAEIRAMLAKLEARQGKPLERVGCITDSPGSGITWRYGKRKIQLLVDATCSDTDADASIAQLDAIDRKLAALAKAASDLKETAEMPELGGFW